MTQFILTKESPEIIRFFRNISTLSKMLDDQEKNFRPVLNGERYRSSEIQEFLQKRGKKDKGGNTNMGKLC